MRITPAIALSLGFGCRSPTPEVPPPSPATGLSPPTIEVELPDPPSPDAFGSVALIEWDPGLGVPWSRLTGVFTREPPAIVNLAECLHGHSVCLDATGPQDQGVTPASDLPDLSLWSLQLVGPRIQLGPHSVGIDGTATSEWVYFEGWEPQVPLEDAPLGLFFDGGMWEPADGQVVVSPPGAFVMHPFAHPLAEVRPGENLEINWIPTDADTVELTLWSGDQLGDLLGATRLRRHYRLEDDGHFAISVDDLGLNNANRSVRLVLSASNTVVGRVGDGEVTVTVQRDRERMLWHSPTILRDRLILGDECTDAAGHPVVPGPFWADLETLTDTQTWAVDETWSPGLDGFASLTLAPGERVTVSAGIVQGDVSLALFPACGDPAVAFANASVDETLQYTNPGEHAESLVLQVDSSQPLQPPILTVDLAVDVPEPVADLGCTASSLEAGEHDIELVTENMPWCADDVEVGRFQAPVEIPPEGRLHVVPSGPVGLHFTDTSCATECPDPLGLAYLPLEVTNHAAVPLPGSLVVTQAARPLAGPVGIEVSILSPVPSDASPSCGGDTPRYGTGTYWLHGSLDAFPDSTGDVCDVATVATGEDAFLQVDLAPGQTMRAEYSPESFFGMMYLRHGCGSDSLVCTNGISPGASRDLEYTNHTGAPETLTLVLDTDRFSALSAPGGPYTLFLDVR